MTIPLPETSEGTIAHKAVEVLGKELGRFSSLALGPGLTTHPETVDFVKDLLRLVKVPIVIDADGCNALALLSPKVLEATSGTVCLTPHPGEMARLLGSSTAEVQSDRLVAALEAARRFGAITVLKGARTLIASPDGEVSINLTGNPGMASGGVGDVLTGLIGGLLARGLTPLDACRAGVYLHGFAGDLASKTVGEIALTASDLLKALPQAIHQVVEAQTAPPLPFCLR
jgi:NAD(P)H-hydrate epimerase